MMLTLEEIESSRLEQIIQQHKFRGTPKEVFEKRLAESLANQTSVTGAELMVLALEALAPENPGISNAAGHHGGAILPFYEYYTKSRLFEGYDHVPHEQIGGHMAEGAGYFGIVGVAKGTSGPGATNLVTAIFDSFMDSKPTVYIVGNVSQAVKDSMAFQEAPITDIVERITKKVYYVTDTRDLPKALYEAFATAASGRPGPVLIDVPKDVQLAKINSLEINYDFNEPVVTNGNLENIVMGLQTLAQMLPIFKRPVLYVGAGARHAWQELREFALRFGIPVTTTLKGKGIFPETHPLSLGMLGMHGTAYANLAVDEADAVFAVGARFDDRVTGNPRKWAEEAYIVHMDVDPRGIGPKGIRRPQLTIQADTKLALQILNSLKIRLPELSAWHERIDDLKAKFPLDYDSRFELFKPKTLTSKFTTYVKTLPVISNYLPHDPIKPQYAIEMIYRLTGGKHVVVADVGQHQMWAAQFYLADNPFQFDTSGGSGTMGYSMPAALGIDKILRHLGRTEKVSVIVGDESFMMTPQTLDVYARRNANIKVFVIDNKPPNGTPGGMVRQWYKRVHKNTQHPVRDVRDIARIARGFGVSAETVRYVGQVEGAIKRALRRDGPYLVCFKVDWDEDCLPMIPGGGTIDQIITYQNQRAIKH